MFNTWGWSVCIVFDGLEFLLLFKLALFILLFEAELFILLFEPGLFILLFEPGLFILLFEAESLILLFEVELVVSWLFDIPISSSIGRFSDNLAADLTAWKELKKKLGKN